MGSSFTTTRSCRFLRAAVLVGIVAVLCGTVPTCARKPVSVSRRKTRNAEPTSASEAKTAATRLNKLGNRYFGIHECDSAFACYRQGLALAEKFDLADQRYFMLANMANTYDDRAHTEGRSVEQALADLDSAAALYTQLLAMVRTTDDPHREALLLFNVASFYYQSRQEPARADGLFTQSIAVSERSGDEDTRVLAVYDRAFARVQLLRLEDARRDFADALKSYQDRRVAGNPNVAWAEHHIEVLDTLIDLKNRMPTREWKQIVEEHRDEFRETAREVKKLGVAEPSGFGNKADGK